MSCDEDEALWFKFSRSFKPSTDSTVRRRRTWRVLLVHHDHEDLNIDDGDGNRGIILPGSNRILIDASRSVRVIQATALHEVNTAINQMDQVTQQNAALVEEAAAAADLIPAVSA